MSQQSEIGRPPVLDKVKKAEICAIVAMGCSRTTAARYVGCHRDTIRKTACRDAQFAAALERADSQHEMRHMGLINKAAEEAKYWRAAAWALERSYPSRYAARRADLFTGEQVLQMLSQFSAVLLEEVADKAQTDRVMARLSELRAEFRADEEKDE